MKRYRWFTGVGLAVIAMVGCSPDVVDPGWHLYKPDGAYSVASPVEFMTAAGCLSLGRHGTIGAIVVARPDTGFNLFDCKGLSRDSLRKLTREYRHLLVEAKLHGASIIVPPGDGTGYYQLVDFNQVCGDANSGGSGGRYYSGPAYVLPELGVTATCWNVYTYRWVSYGGAAAGTAPDGSTPGGSGFPSGPPPTTSTPYPPLPPPPPPPPWTDADDCNPNVPGCLIALKSKQMKYLQKALDYMDTTAAVCAAAVAIERQLLNNGQVFYGATNANVAPTGVQPVPDHSALTMFQTDQSGKVIFVKGLPIVATQHVDQGTFKATMNDGTPNTAGQMGLLLVHEGMHALGNSHPGEAGPPYQTPPFNLSNVPSSPSQASCVKPGVIAY